jgi:nucleotide-binding universal stress UspA family protein
VSIRTILVPVFGDEADSQTLAAAAEVAGQLGGFITALYCETAPTHSLPTKGGGWASAFLFSDSMIDTIKEAAARRRHAAERNYARWLQAATPSAVTPDGPRMPRAEFVAAAGTIPEVVQDYAVVADLVVVPLGIEDDARAALLASVLIDWRRPVLATPQSLTTRRLGGPVTIAWNYSAQSARALNAAMPILEPMGEAVVLMAGHHQDDEAARRVVTYLAHHGVKAEALKLGDQDEPARLIAAKARELDSRLLVMGAYSRTRARELVFGGMTHYMLENPPIPLFLVR